MAPLSRLRNCMVPRQALKAAWNSDWPRDFLKETNVRRNLGPNLVLYKLPTMSRYICATRSPLFPLVSAAVRS